MTFENARIGLSPAVMPQSSARTSITRSDAADASPTGAFDTAATNAFEIDNPAKIAEEAINLHIFRGAKV
jgi:hypothetical protein